MRPPIVMKQIPAQVINEGAAYGPFDLKQYIQVLGDSPSAQFTAELKDGSILPNGLICTLDGILTGIPAKGTQGNYEVIVTAENDIGSTQTLLLLTIKPAFLPEEANFLNVLKTQVWEALADNLPIPDLDSLYQRPITLGEVYYLLERWGVLKIWDAFNFDPAGEKNLLHLPDASEHYYVYDRGSCLVMTPKDLFSDKRTLNDGLVTARAMAREAYKRNWPVELIGFEKFTRAAWIELQHLGDKHGHALEIVNYQPSHLDLKLYTEEARAIQRKHGLG